MTHRINRWAVAFLTLQGLGCLVWWGVLCLRPEVRQWFTATDAPDTTLMAFAAPDLLLFAAGSLVVAWGTGHTGGMGLAGPVRACRRRGLRRAVLCESVAAVPVRLGGGCADDAVAGDCARHHMAAAAEGVDRNTTAEVFRAVCLP